MMILIVGYSVMDIVHVILLISHGQKMVLEILHVMDECRESIIKCPEYGKCHIICSAETACYSANIIWPKNGTGSITCDGEYACSYVTFPQPPPFEDMVLNCNEEAECRESIIKCPEYGNCHIICSAETACYSANIIWPKNGTGSI
eukprot:74353_1